MSGDGQKFGGEVHNFWNEYKIKFESHQNASGRWQLGLKTQSNDDNLAVQLHITHLKNYYNGMKEAGFLPVEVKTFIPKEKKEEKIDG